MRSSSNSPEKAPEAAHPEILARMVGRAGRAARAAGHPLPPTISTRSICMTTTDIDTATAEQLAPILYAAIQRLGQLGRTGAVALAALVEDDDADFEEASSWIGDIAAGDLRE
jgi:hypothetical protein